jgi:hypothetical protein
MECDPGVKAPGHQVDYSRRSHFEPKIVWSYTSTPLCSILRSAMRETDSGRSKHSHYYWVHSALEKSPIFSARARNVLMKVLLT